MTKLDEIVGRVGEQGKLLPKELGGVPDFLGIQQLRALAGSLDAFGLGSSPGSTRQW